MKLKDLHETSPRLRSRRVIKDILYRALKAGFPDDTVDISDGFEDNIHVVVVSRRFDPLSEKQKQNVLWRIIDRTNLSKSEKLLISLVYPVSIAEIK